MGLGMQAPKFAAWPGIVVDLCGSRGGSARRFRVWAGRGTVSREEAERTARLGKTALILACEIGHIEAARLLVDKGADVNAQDRSAWTSVFLVTP